MPIAKLEFTLPDDRVEFRDAVEGQAARAALWEVDQACRRMLKHGGLSEESEKCVQSIRDLIRDAPGLTPE